MPARYNITRDVVERPIAEGRGGDVALRDARGTLTFRELSAAIDGLARGLTTLGILRGITFLVLSPNCREAFLAFLAGVKLGAVPILANSLLGVRDLLHVIQNAEPAVAIVHGDVAGALREIQSNHRPLREVVVIGGAGRGEIDFEALLGDGEPVETADTSKDAPAFINYTSGTTGAPKVIVQAHRWVVGNGDFARLHMPMTSADVVIHTSEFSFGWGLGHGFLWALRNGGSVAIMAGRPNAERVLAAVEQFGGTVLATVPTLIRAILALPNVETRYRLSTLRATYVAGEPLAEPTYREWRRRFPGDLYDVYGASEFQVIVANGPAFPVKPGSMGLPNPGMVIRVLDDALRECGPRQIGTLMVRADDPALFLEYRKQPDKWCEAHREGWYNTRDQVYEDEDGYLWYVGRQDDLFKSRGYLISPKEVEDVILTHPKVVEAAVIARPDPEVGNRIAAFVVLQPGTAGCDALVEEIRQTVRALIAPYKVPHTVNFRESLPKSPVGKVLRRALRDSPPA